MAPNMFNNSNNYRRSGTDHRFRPVERSDVEKLLNGNGRFRRQKEIADITSKSSKDDVADHQGTDINGCFGNERRSNRDRRCGLDTRPEIEQFLQGERRSHLDQRSHLKDGYRSFKKARAFVRNLGLKSLSEWHHYTKSGMKPDGIPTAPQEVYADYGWAGWNDWLGTSAGAPYHSRHRFLEPTLAFLRRLGLGIYRPQPK